MTYCVDPHSETPPSRQIVDAVLDAMARGELVAGHRLPSIRSMAAEALVNPNTVGKAYRELEHMRVVIGRNGSGVFVTDEGEAIARARRREATLESFEKSVRGALLAGHEDADLLASLQDIITEAVRLAGAPASPREKVGEKR